VSPTAFTLSTFLTLFVVIDPPALIPVFLSMTAGHSQEERRRTARRAAWIAFLVLSGFAVLGSSALSLLGVSMASFRMAGGLLLLLLAIDMVGARTSRQRATPEEQAEGLEKEDISVFPLAIPMLAGPGATSTVLVLMSRSPQLWEKAVVFAGLAMSCLLSFLALSVAQAVAERLGRTGLNVIQRVMGLLLAGAAVQFFVDGWHASFP